MELEVKEYQLPAEISFNFEELKQEITAKVSYYEMLTYTEDQIAEAKKDKASLNKLKKALNDERIRLEREYMKPFDVFKAQVKELCNLIDKPVALIDEQIKNVEEEKKELKRLEIGSYFTVQPHPEWLKMTMIFNEKWLNASYKMQDIKDEMTMAIAIIERNVATLEALPEFGFEALEEYKRTLDFNKAIEEGQRLADIQKRKAEEAKKKAEEEAQKAQEEAEKPQTINKPTEEEKPTEEPQSEPKIKEEKKWRNLGGFLTDAEMNLLFMFCADNEIELMEV